MAEQYIVKLSPTSESPPIELSIIYIEKGRKKEQRCIKGQTSYTGKISVHYTPSVSNVKHREWVADSIYTYSRAMKKLYSIYPTATLARAL